MPRRPYYFRELWELMSNSTVPQITSPLVGEEEKS